MNKNLRSVASFVMVLCALAIAIFALHMITLDHETIKIGPNTPYAWQKNDRLQGKGEIFLESENNPVTIFFLDENREKQYLTQTVERETPLGQNQTFYGQFLAYEGSDYRTSDTVSVYSKTSKEITIISFPAIDILYMLIAIWIFCYFADILEAR